MGQGLTHPMLESANDQPEAGVPYFDQGDNNNTSSELIEGPFKPSAPSTSPEQDIPASTIEQAPSHQDQQEIAECENQDPHVLNDETPSQTKEEESKQELGTTDDIQMDDIDEEVAGLMAEEEEDEDVENDEEDDGVVCPVPFRWDGAKFNRSDPIPIPESKSGEYRFHSLTEFVFDEGTRMYKLPMGPHPSIGMNTEELVNYLIDFRNKRPRSLTPIPEANEGADFCGLEWDEGTFQKAKKPKENVEELAVQAASSTTDVNNNTIGIADWIDNFKDYRPAENLQPITFSTSNFQPYKATQQ
ncbi:uncharacterized protein LOC118434506 [Folsomia candida]|uniref:uncharacterized protein LOC118434506 n=1 Tax=Folsomia candida TaxID=158441 RepID=UPI00160526F1|nr:uncharacterized protein LOC118434506 [Folsomia candida]